MVDVAGFPLKLACQAPEVGLGTGKLGAALGEVSFASAHLDAPFVEMLDVLRTQQKRFVIGKRRPFSPSGFELLGQGLDAGRGVGIFPLGGFQCLARIRWKRRHLAQRRDRGIQLGFSAHIPTNAANAAQLSQFDRLPLDVLLKGSAGLLDGLEATFEFLPPAGGDCMLAERALCGF